MVEYDKIIKKGVQKAKNSGLGSGGGGQPLSLDLSSYDRNYEFSYVPFTTMHTNIQWFTRNGIGIGIGIGNGIGICKLFKQSKLQASFIKMPPRLESWKDNE